MEGRRQPTASGRQDSTLFAASVHRLPRGTVGDRVERILRLAQGKRVIDLGFVDQGRMLAKRVDGTWLHADLQRVARELIGIDFDAQGVALAKELGYEAHCADCQNAESLSKLRLAPADVLVAGELLEHLDSPGAFLDAAKTLVTSSGILVITTPNCLSLTNFLAALVGRELVNPDHVAWHSPRTVATLLGRHGWHLRERSFYRFPAVTNGFAPARTTPRQVALFHGYQTLARPLFKIRPWLADGLIVVASRHIDRDTHEEGD